MSNNLQQHPMNEVYKQLRFSMKKNGLETIQVQVTRRAGKFDINFTGSPEQVVKAKQILAAWNWTSTEGRPALLVNPNSSSADWLIAQRNSFAQLKGEAVTVVAEAAD